MSIIIKKYQVSYLDSLKELISEHFEKISFKDYKQTENNFSVIAIVDEAVIGHVAVTKVFDPFKSIYYFHLDYICVKKAYQNKKIASMLLDKIEELAKEENIAYLELTSRQERKIAQHLYLKQGFFIRDTNVFKKIIIK